MQAHMSLKKQVVLVLPRATGIFHSPNTNPPPFMLLSVPSARKELGVWQPHYSPYQAKGLAGWDGETRGPTGTLSWPQTRPARFLLPCPGWPVLSKVLCPLPRGNTCPPSFALGSAPWDVSSSERVHHEPPQHGSLWVPSSIGYMRGF